jgi:membrane fusion protein (multidrug efflux system)
MKKRVLLIGIALTVLITAFLFISRKDGKDEPIVTTGIVEGTEVNLSSKVSGRILEFCCKEGDRVSGGHILVRLDSNDINASVEQARAGVLRAKADITSAEASVKNSEANIRSTEAEIDSAHADKEKTKSQMAEAEKEMHRAEFLYKNELISIKEVDLAIMTYETSTASYNAAEAKIKAAIARKESAISQLNSSRSLVASAIARLKEAEASLNFQEARLDDTVIRTPISGTVVLKALEAGEVVSPGITILSIVDLDDLWVRIDMEETLIGLVKIGSEVAIHVDGMPGVVFNGTVAEIGKEADFATQRDVTRGRQDIKTFGIKIKTTDKTGTLKPGMTVMVEIPRKG